MINYILISESQRITLYTNKKTTPFRDGYIIIQIKRSILLDNCKLFKTEISSDFCGNFPALCKKIKVKRETINF